MRGHFRYLRFKTFPMTPRTSQCEVFWALLSSSEHSGVLEGSKPPTFPSVGLHPHTWPKWGCDMRCLRMMKCASVRVPCCGEPCLIKKINILIHDNLVTCVSLSSSSKNKSALCSHFLQHLCKFLVLIPKNMCYVESIILVNYSNGLY
jgi:hypothetical protein